MKFGHKIPAVPNPVGDICVQVTIPAHPDYVALFVRTVRILETNRIYQRDELNGETVKIVQQQWRTRTVTPLIEALATGTGSCGVDGECLAYPPFANFISYFPQNPYTEPDLIPDGFLIPPFYVNGKDPAHTLPNYNTGDVIVAFDSISLELSWDLAKTPRIELCLEGSGVCEIHLLNIVQGGSAILGLDNPVDLGDIIAGIIDDDLEIIDLNQDIVSLPPETAAEIILEIEVPTEGEHVIYIYFLPTLNDSLIPLGFGGGIREISLCGNLRPCGSPAPEPPPPLEGVEELKPEFQFTADCGLEYRYRNQDDEIISDWQPVPGWTENFADCVGGMNMSMDYDALKLAIQNAIYDAGNDFAKQLVSGSKGGFSVDDDGNVTSGDDGHVNVPPVPPDDPETPLFDEALAANCGGCKKVTAGYNEIWKDMNAWKIAGLSDDVMSFRLQAKYQMVSDTLTDQFVYEYSAAYATSHIASYSEALSERFFCFDGNFKNQVADYIIDVVPLSLQLNAFKLNDALEDAQISQWFTQGSGIPSTDYQAYNCTKIDDETLTFDMSTADTVQRTTAGFWKPGHRFLIDVVGTYTDSDIPNVTNDGMYSHNLTTGVKSFNPVTFNSGTDAVPTPTQGQVPFEDSHHYQFTVDKIPLSLAQTCIVSVTNGIFALPNVSGTITIIVKDLGQYSL